MKTALVVGISCALLVCASWAQAETYTVATTGDDTAAGTDAAPWKTLQFAAGKVAAGDTVIVKPGSYVGFNLQTAGTQALPIVFKAEPGVTIDEGNADTDDGVNVENASYVIIDGFTVISKVPGGIRNGLRAAVCDHVTFRNNKVQGAQKRGILTGHCDDLLIEDNQCSGSIDEHGIYVSNSGDRPIIRRNLVFDNNGCGVHMNGDASMGGDGIISEALVEANIAYNNGKGGGSGINCDGVQSSLFRNNLIYNSHASGISLYVGDSAEPSKNNVVVNNTVLVASDGRWALNIRDGATGNTVYNNILFSYHSFRGSIDVAADAFASLTSDYNVVMDRFTNDDSSTVMTLAQWQAAVGKDAHSMVAAPAALFQNETGNDFHLSASSPAIDKGTSTQAPPGDLEGNARPMGAAIDIGAYEFCTGGSCVVADGGTAGMGGAAGTGGAAGAGGSGGAAAGSGGTAGMAGGGQGGSVDGGGADAGGSSGSSAAPAAASSDDSGCGCRSAAGGRAIGSLWMVALAALGLVRRRRRSGNAR